jgi:hypothetical protein
MLDPSQRCDRNSVTACIIRKLLCFVSRGLVPDVGTGIQVQKIEGKRAMFQPSCQNLYLMEYGLDFRPAVKP